MQNDEEAIRKVVETWLDASAKGDLATVLSLMDDDVIFMVPGQMPFGKKEFIAGNQAMKDMKIEGKSDIQEIKVLGDWAWMRQLLKVKFTQPDGKTEEKSGYTLTILRKNQDGHWVITRDANLLTAGIAE